VRSCRSKLGVVTLFDETCFAKERPASVKTFMNLTTAVDTLEFNATGEVLLMASSAKHDQLRLVRTCLVGGCGCSSELRAQAHCGSRAVFSNWPTSQTPLGHVFSAAFSSRSDYVAIGNAKGRALLYQLDHFA
jgi:U3 small nucleolar RNA-associated protein 18